MSAAVEIIAGIAIIGYVIGRQLRGEPLRGRRVVLLPAILTVVGVLDLGGNHVRVRPVDVGCLIVGGVVVAAIGLGQGAVTRLESRNGYLWGQLPTQGLWLWLLLIGARVMMTLLAHGLGAEVAGSSSTILLMLGINRLGQAAVVLVRAMSAGVAFAPEKDGSSFLSGLTGQPPPTAASLSEVAPAASTVSRPRPAGVDWTAVGRQVAAFVEHRRRER